MYNSNMRFTQTDLLTRHWTRKTIRELLGEPDEIRRIQYGRRVYLFDYERVVELEKGAAFRAARTRLFTAREKLARNKAVRDEAGLAWAEGLDLFEEKADLEAAAYIYGRMREFEKEEPWNWIAGSLVPWPSYSPPDERSLQVLKRLIRLGYVTVKKTAGMKGWTKAHLVSVTFTVPKIETMHEVSNWDA
jgi:hypothetical protein